MWCRIFAAIEDEIPPDMLAEAVYQAGLSAEPHFRGDDLGWTAGDFRDSQKGTMIRLERYLVEHDAIREDLNICAAAIEPIDHPNVPLLMRLIIQARQLITLNADDPEAPLRELACFIASRLDGLIEMDGQGWFNAQGELLLPETLS